MKSKILFQSIFSLFVSTIAVAQASEIFSASSVDDNEHLSNLEESQSYSNHAQVNTKHYKVTENTGSWKGFSHLFLVIGKAKNSNTPTCEFNGESFEHITASLGESSGQIINYSGWRKSDGTTMEPLQIRATDNVEVSNTHKTDNGLHCKGETCELILSDGTRRVYKKVQNLPSLVQAEEIVPLLARQVDTPEYFRLAQEVLPNSNQLFYSFDSTGHLFSIDIIEKNASQKQLKHGFPAGPQAASDKTLAAEVNSKRFTYSENGLNYLENEVDHEGNETLYFYETSKNAVSDSKKQDLQANVGKASNSNSIHKKDLKDDRSFSPAKYFLDNKQNAGVDALPDFKDLSASCKCHRSEQGPPGPQGATGPTGATGATGATGTFGVNAWLITGNAGTSPTAGNFLGTTDNNPLVIATNGNLPPTGGTRFTTNGQIETIGTGESVFLGEGAGISTIIGTGVDNVFVGYHAGFSNTTGAQNIAIGAFAFETNATGPNNIAIGYGALNSNVSGFSNTVVGNFSGIFNTSGTRNSALGLNSLFNNTTGSRNLALGFGALATNFTGVENTAVGYQALNTNTVSQNTGVGAFALFANTTGTLNAAVGYQALTNNTTGIANTGVGYQALMANSTGQQNSALGFRSLPANTTGSFNTALGVNALNVNTVGTQNTAVGVTALNANTNGTSNTAVGVNALRSNISGVQNTAVGVQALNSNTASNNTAVGMQALFANTSGTQNAALGLQALFSNTTASGNSAFGFNSLLDNTTGNLNTAVGANTLSLNVTGASNTAVGNSALNVNVGSVNTAIGAASLIFNTSGGQNTAVGSGSMGSNTTGTLNTAIGLNALLANTTGNSNTALGALANVSAGNLTNATAVGFGAVVTASNSMRFGNNAVVSWGFAANPGAGQALVVGITGGSGNGASLTTGGVWTNGSDRSIKYDVRNIDYGLNEILRLHPVKYKLINTHQDDIGFIAQEVKEVIPEIVYGEEGSMTLSYSQITSVLTKAMQEQQVMIDDLKREIELLKAQRQ